MGSNLVRALRNARQHVHPHETCTEFCNKCEPGVEAHCLSSSTASSFSSSFINEFLVFNSSLRYSSTFFFNSGSHEKGQTPKHVPHSKTCSKPSHRLVVFPLKIKVAGFTLGLRSRPWLQAHILRAEARDADRGRDVHVAFPLPLPRPLTRKLFEICGCQLPLRSNVHPIFGLFVIVLASP